jgi:hypothetical protein
MGSQPDRSFDMQVFPLAVAAFLAGTAALGASTIAGDTFLAESSPDPGFRGTGVALSTPAPRCGLSVEARVGCDIAFFDLRDRLTVDWTGPASVEIGFLHPLFPEGPTAPISFLLDDLDFRQDGIRALIVGASFDPDAGTIGRFLFDPATNPDGIRGFREPDISVTPTSVFIDFPDMPADLFEVYPQLGFEIETAPVPLPPAAAMLVVALAGTVALGWSTRRVPGRLNKAPRIAP